MKDLLKTILVFWLEILLGLLILFAVDDIRIFLLYIFIVLLVVSARQTDYLRKLIRVFQIANEIKIIAITRKLKITEDEISIVADGERQKMGQKKWSEIEKELQDLMN